MEIIKKDITQVKLTVTPTRVTLKFPLSFDDNVEEERVIKFAENIASRLQPKVTQSFRGKIEKYNNIYGICLYSNKRSGSRNLHKPIYHVYFDENTLDSEVIKNEHVDS